MAKFYRLRGDCEIHLKTCPKIVAQLADDENDDVVPATDGEGMPAYCCRHDEAVAWMEAHRRKFGGK